MIGNPKSSSSHPHPWQLAEICASTAEILCFWSQGHRPQVGVLRCVEPGQWALMIQGMTGAQVKTQKQWAISTDLMVPRIEHWDF